MANKRTDLAVRQYLARYAELEAAAPLDLGIHDHVLVVPACRESPDLLDGYTVAARAAFGRVLCILVVNGTEDAEEHAVLDNRKLLEGLRARLGSVSVAREAAIEFGRTGALDVLLIDRASPGRQLPPKQGVGLARKIGLDVALALSSRGSVGPIAHTTDADATLPADYFARTYAVESGGASAAVYPFVHLPSGDASVDERTALHELFLRYWVAGLTFAGSPYAFHTVGSTLAVALLHYARARGVPRRMAGEDFYLLNKLAKLAPVARLPGRPVQLAARRSDRTPFGTGRAVERLERADLALPDPRCFDALGRVLTSLDDLAVHRDMTRYCASVGSEGHSDAYQTVTCQRALEAIGRVCHDSTRVDDRRARLHAWFDAFRTMKLMHMLAERAFPNAPWRDALARANFVPPEPRDVQGVLAALAAREETQANLLGPSLPRAADKVR